MMRLICSGSSVVALRATMAGNTVVSALSDTSFKVGASASTSICASSTQEELLS